ncbi:dedicator of cytokinesis protein 3 isoform X2 [Planococcus citri]|uniref:dedicator of cytokinesis protein 3 isoform X2 n=1 Tax=Planococcus citri TaxID=170843 RepID=UPI0031F7F57B
MWTPTKEKKFGVAIYNWPGEIKYGLPLEIGDTVQIFEECLGWYRGFVTKNRSIKGIFPCNYVHLKPSKLENEGLFETAVPVEDPVVREVTLVLREWNCIWKNLYVERKTYKFVTLRKVMRELLDWRRQLLTGTLTQDQTRELKLRITSQIDYGNRKLGLDLVPRCGAEMVDPSTMSVVELYHVHVQNSESTNNVHNNIHCVTTLSKTGLKRNAPAKVLTHHLYMCMRDFGYFVGEDVEIYFSLYDAKRAKYISERFLVKISKEGFSNYLLKLHNNCTIFTDLGNGDLNRELFMVAHVMRIGKMLHSESSKKLSATLTSSSQYNGCIFKRPFGVGILNIGAELLPSANNATSCEEKEYSFKVYQCEDKEFYQLHEYIIRKQTSKYSPLSAQQHYGATGIDISLKLLDGSFTKVEEENPLLFKNVSLTRKMGYPDVIMPGDVRNDLYITLERGEFERGGKSTGKNIEVTVLVVDIDGEIIDNCLYGASGTEGTDEYHSTIIYHHNSPCWYETIRLRIPLDKYNVAHIRFEFRHCSTRDKADNKKLFGFSFARLMEPEGAILPDGVHELYVYRFDEKIKLDPSLYLMLPSNYNDLENGYKCDYNPLFTCSHKETVFVHTLLCSTKLTQNADLLYLLQWRDHPDRIQEALTRALRLNGEELVKFLQDILDALFSMFSTEDGNSTTHSGLVFHVLASIFHLLYDSKFEHFRPVMDAYIKNHFAAALVYKGLLTSIQHCADRVTATEKQEPIKKCFRSLEYIFKFIIESRLLFARATGGQFEDNFKMDVLGVFAVFNKMLTHSYDTILPTQVALLHSISAVFDLLLQVLSPIDVAKLAIKMIESLPTRDPTPQLIQAKLVLIRNIVSSQLFKCNECRSLLLTNSCRHLRYHLNRRDELRLCMDILTEILSFLYHRSRSPETQGEKASTTLHHEIDIVCLSALDMLIQTVLISMDRSPPILGCLVANLVGLLQLMDECHYQSLWDQLGDRKSLKDFILRIFLVYRNLVKQEVFSTDWLVMKMVMNNVLLNSLHEITKPLIRYFLDSRYNFDSQVWNNYFNLAVEYLTQPALQLEKFSDVKREKIIEKYGDMRVLMGYQMLKVWSKLGEHKVNFIPAMVGPFLEVTLVPESDLRKATLNIFFDMMQTEEKVRGNFKQVESELIDKLDYLINENKGDDEYRQLFNTMEQLSAVLLERIQNEDPNWSETGSAFINSVTRLLERLLDYRSVIQGDENRDKRMSCTVNLLNFYKNEIGRKEMYLRYIYKLHDLHFSADNFTEAGFTLKLYADSLSWSSTNSLPNDSRAKEAPEWKRKEELYHQIVNYFDKGKCWEKGIPLCKELANLYEKQLYDYVKLSSILRTQARFTDNIVSNKLRLEPEYFRVGFYGLSFPLFVRNKVFVYRGLEYERIEAFTQRLQTEFPQAQILTKNSPPSHAILQSESQFIQICNVKPISENGPPSEGVPLASVPSQIARFYQVNDVSKFLLDRPLHKGTIDKENEFKTLWLERTIMTISSSLPGILRWFEVIHSVTEEVPPVRFACETMETVNAELRQLIAVHSADPKQNINPLSMRLQGTIDANVMGGISKYQQAFFTPEFVQSEPHLVPYVHQLNALILDQVDILERGLVVHGQLAPPGVQPLHQRLVERISQLKQNLKKPPIPIQSSPLPLPPSDEKGPDQYTNTVSYQYLSEADDDDDIYSKPIELLESMSLHESSSSHNVELPVAAKRVFGRTKSCGSASIDGISSKIGTAERKKESQKSKIASVKNSQQRHSLESGSVCGNCTHEEAPPLPPRLAVDRRSISEVPPTPPKRISLRKDSETSVSIENTLPRTKLRDSGFSESVTNVVLSSSYEEFLVVRSSSAYTTSGNTPSPPPIPLLSPRTSTGSSLPPPLPPKVLNLLDNEDESSKEQKRNLSVENYSIPKLQNTDVIDLR